MKKKDKNKILSQLDSELAFKNGSLNTIDFQLNCAYDRVWTRKPVKNIQRVF